MMRRRSSMWARWLGWTGLFGLVQAGLLSMLSQYDWPLPDEVLAILLVSLITLAFFIGLRLGTWWWTLGPVVAYTVHAALYLNHVAAQYQAMERPPVDGIAWIELAVILGAMFVMAPCTLAALAGVAAAAIARSRGADRRRSKRPGRSRWTLMSAQDDATPRDILVARSLAMTSAPSSSNREPGEVDLLEQRPKPEGRQVVPELTFDPGVRGE